MRQFFAEFNIERWTCGDGCCSDYWHEFYLYEIKDGRKEFLYVHREIRGVYSEEYAREIAGDEIEGRFGLKPGEYELTMDYSEY